EELIQEIKEMLRSTASTANFMFLRLFENNPMYSIFYYLSDKNSPDCFLNYRLSRGKIENSEKNFLEIKQEILKILSEYYNFLNSLCPKILIMKEHCKKFPECSLFYTFSISQQDVKTIQTEKIITDKYVIDFCENLMKLFGIIARNIKLFSFRELDYVLDAWDIKDVLNCKYSYGDLGDICCYLEALSEVLLQHIKSKETLKEFLSILAN
ncbi:MAG: hypothetical protein LBJ32_04360, partial [Oscillospiraceae bacterium]|nr:hypothetical protein [Oscillospiraceae bacterium]